MVATRRTLAPGAHAVAAALAVEAGNAADAAQYGIHADVADDDAG